MPQHYEPLEPELESMIRARLAGNPIINFLGVEVPELGRGYAKFVLPFRSGYANSIGLLQGGMIASLADEAVAYALWSLTPGEETISTVEMKINFLAPVRQGPVTAVARIIRRGRTISLGDVEVFGPEGKMAAKGLCTYIHLQPR